MSNPNTAAAATIEALISTIDDDTKLLRLPEVKQIVGMGTTQIYDLIRSGEFPKAIKLGRKHAVWLSTQVTEWKKRAVREALMKSVG